MTPDPTRTSGGERLRFGDQSRRTVLRALAATGSTAALGGVAIAQDDGADDAGDDGKGEAAGIEGIPIAGNFPEGETVGLRKVAEGLPAPTDLEYVEVDGEAHHFLVTQTGQIFRFDPGPSGGGTDDGEADEGMGDEGETDADGNEGGDADDGDDAGEGDGTDGGNETDDGGGTDGDGGNGTEGDGGNGANEFVFNGTVTAWFGAEPDQIADEENPTLELVAGETYTVTWENGDGQPHNFVILDESDDIIERTEIVREQGETQTLEFEATEEMYRYVCEVHPGTMSGRIRATADGDEADDEAGEGEADAPAEMDVFLDLEDRLVNLGIGELGNYDERGLLSVAFHPEFAENRLFYVRYSAPEREGLGYNHTDVLAEFQADENFESADPDSERTIMEIPQPQDNHNGGQLAFGPDGYLYTSVGDGGNVHDIGIGHVDDWYDENEGGNAQDTTANPLGGIHRIDVDAEDDAEFGEYGIPEDNPLVDSEDGLSEYWAWGFRNPWGMSIDDDGRVFVADAGQHRVESVYAVEGGGNYSWNVKEGSFCFSPEAPLEAVEDCPDEVGEGAGEARAGEPLRDPIAEYRHNRISEAFIDSSVVTGGHRYAGEAIPELEDAFVFGNWSSEGVAEADGEVLVAIDPGTGAGGADDEEADDADETGNAGNETGNGDEGGGGQEGNETENGDTDAEAGNGDDGTDGATGDDLVEVDERWELQELQFEGAADESLNRYVYGVARDAAGELYVLANTDFRPFPETGEVYKIVPAEEGEEVPEPEETYTVGEDDDEVEDDPAEEDPDDADEGEEAFPEDEGNGGDGNETDDGAGNETGGEGDDGNETTDD